jgi:hypothetical protein
MRPSSPSPSVLRRSLIGALATAVAGALAVTLLVGLHPGGAGQATTVASTNPVTPGNFTGYGFDQCQAPAQSAMDTWLANSPYLAVGVYISGDSRGCRTQTYLNATWVTTQLAHGWHLLPITLGPQASCNPRFPRYGNDPTIKPNPGTNGLYGAATTQGTAEATKTVAAAQALGLVRGSTMYYDLEAFTYANTDCRESALHFLSAWTQQLHRLGYLSGVYSSGSSGVKALDQARLTRPGTYTMPDQLWIADWDQQAGTTSAYVSSTGWMPSARVKQYNGGHNEKYAGVNINIDNDFVDVGTGTTAPPERQSCGSTSIDLATYPNVHLSGANKPTVGTVKTLKCLLKGQGLFTGKVRRGLGAGFVAAVHAFQARHHWQQTSTFAKRAWVALLSAGPHVTVKYGSGSDDVRALQRALNASNNKVRLPVTGVFAAMTATDLKAYQQKVGLPATGVASTTTWVALAAGRK